VKALSIDFAWGRRSSGRLAGSLALIAALGVVGAQIARYWDACNVRESLDDDRRRAQHRLSAASAPLSPDAKERQQVELRFAARVIDKLDQPWDVLFGAVEGIAGSRVALLSIDPDPDRREVRLTAEAKDFDAMMEYARMARLDTTLRGYLTGHQVNLQDPLRPQRFTLSAQWPSAAAISSQAFAPVAKP
jgi:hypothetical protein